MPNDRQALETAVYQWWSRNIQSRKTDSFARGCSARLRRADDMMILSEPVVHDLAHAIGATPRDAKRLASVVGLVAGVRENSTFSLPQRLGAGDKPAFSPSRFQTLMRAESPEVVRLLRRAIPASNWCCNVGKLAADVWFWNDHIRRQWCFDYYGASQNNAS